MVEEVKIRFYYFWGGRIRGDCGWLCYWRCWRREGVVVVMLVVLMFVGYCSYGVRDGGGGVERRRRGVRIEKGRFGIILKFLVDY